MKSDNDRYVGVMVMGRVRRAPGSYIINMVYHVYLDTTFPH